MSLPAQEDWELGNKRVPGLQMGRVSESKEWSQVSLVREGDGWDNDREAGEKGKKREEKTQAGFTGRRFQKCK